MRGIKGLARALNDSGRFKYKVRMNLLLLLLVILTTEAYPIFQEPEFVVDYLVIGGGISQRDS